MPPITDPSLSCFHCGKPIPFTESLAAPLIEAIRAKCEQPLQAQADRFAEEKRPVAAQQVANQQLAAQLEEASRKQQQEVARAVQDQVHIQLVVDCQNITDQETTRARQQIEDERGAERETARLQAHRVAGLSATLTIAQAEKRTCFAKNSSTRIANGRLSLSLWHS